MMARLKGIKKDFKNIAFIGPNPDLFLLHLPKNFAVDSFTFIEQTEAQVKFSYDSITKKIDSGFYSKNLVNIPDIIEPCILDDE